MATNVPYKREGDDPDLAWNEVIRRINEMTAECAGVDPLPEVDENHRWKKSDIQAAQDKLLELCSEFSFTPPPDKWKQSTIDALIAAINEGQCCCEEEDRTPPRLRAFAPAGFLLFNSVGPGNTFQTFDWAGWIMQELEPLVIEMVPCPVEPGEDPVFIERRSGGRGWVGREYTSWEVEFYTESIGNDGAPVASGPVVDGYIDIGEGSWRREQVCGEPLGSGTPLGETDPAWGFPYVVTFASGSWTITGADGRAASLPTSAFQLNDEMLPTGWVTTPYGAIVVTDGVEHTLTAYLRLKCE